jgi:hypothetical protein
LELKEQGRFSPFYIKRRKLKMNIENLKGRKAQMNEEYMELKLEKDLQDFAKEMASLDADELLERYKIAVVEHNENFLIREWREGNGRFYKLIEAEMMKRIGGNEK